MSFGKPTFTLKTYGPKLYKWSPDTSKQPANKPVVNKPFYCTATAGSQGQDWTVTYVYDTVVAANGQAERLAYVECDYME